MYTNLPVFFTFYNNLSEHDADSLYRWSLEHSTEPGALVVWTIAPKHPHEPWVDNVNELLKSEGLSEGDVAILEVI